MSLAIWDHTVLLATRHKWAHPAIVHMCQNYDLWKLVDSTVDKVLGIIIRLTFGPSFSLIGLYCKFYVNHSQESYSLKLIWYQQNADERPVKEIKNHVYIFSWLFRNDISEIIPIKATRINSNPNILISPPSHLQNMVVIHIAEVNNERNSKDKSSAPVVIADRTS